MTDREKLQKQIVSNTSKIDNLQAINEGLEHEAMLLCDEQQRYTEHLETSTFKENGKRIQVERVIGRIHWKQIFKDENNPNGLELERSENVRIDGVWLR